MLESIALRGLLSFGWEKPLVPLNRLNLLIGANGSGKTNLLEVLQLLSALPGDLQEFFSDNGGGPEWLHKGPEGDNLAELEIVISDSSLPKALRYALQLRQEGPRLVVAQEQLATRDPYPEDTPFLFAIRNEQAANVKASSLARGSDSDPLFGNYQWQAWGQSELGSILNSVGQNFQPQIASLARLLRSLRAYTHWLFGPDSFLREPQKADLSGERLSPSGRNLAMVLAKLREDRQVWQQFLDIFRLAYEQVQDVEIVPQGGNKLMIFVNEGRYSVPATRLSDGTLRWLFFSTLLCDPKPPPLLLLEEPEMGLHPDLIRKLGELLKAASERTQLVVTTHSVELVNEFSDTPEDVIVCERPFGSTVLRRLEREPLLAWLEDYKLGAAWQAGALGGNRF